MSEVPTGWVSVRLEDLGTFNPKHGRDVPEDLPVSFVPMAAVSDSLGEIESPQVRPYGQIRKGFTHFQTGDVIFAKITPCMENGKIAVARHLHNDLACGTTEFHVLRPASGVSPDLLWRFLRQESFRGDAEQSMTGAVGQRRVPVEYLKKSILPLPPLLEQRRIVAKLDSLSGKSKRARDHLDHLPLLVKKYKQAVLTVAFRGGLTSDRGGFDHRALGTLTSLITKGASPKWQGFQYVEKGLLFVRSQNVGWGDLILDDRAFLPPEFERIQKRSVIRTNDVLLNIVGASIGRAAVATTELDGANCNQAVAIIRLVDKGATARFVCYWLLSQDAQSKIASGSVDFARANFSLANIRDLKLPWPSEDKRAEIVRRVEHAFTWIDRLAAEATSARKLVERLDQAILAKAFRGELVPQDPNDEPASVLLDRIRAEPKLKAERPKRGPRRSPVI